MDMRYTITEINGVWRVFDTQGGGWVAHVKSSTKAGAARQLAALSPSGEKQ